MMMSDIFNKLPQSLSTAIMKPFLPVSDYETITSISRFLQRSDSIWTDFAKSIVDARSTFVDILRLSSSKSLTNSELVVDITPSPAPLFKEPAQRRVLAFLQPDSSSNCVRLLAAGYIGFLTSSFFFIAIPAAGFFSFFILVPGCLSAFIMVAE